MLYIIDFIHRYSRYTAWNMLDSLLSWSQSLLSFQPVLIVFETLLLRTDCLCERRS